jgi:hypothetical protein
MAQSEGTTPGAENAEEPREQECWGRVRIVNLGAGRCNPGWEQVWGIRTGVLQRVKAPHVA